MKKKSLMVFMLVFAASISYAGKNNPDISGLWLTSSKKMKVKISQEKKVYVGRVHWHDAEAKQKKEQGSVLLHDLRYNTKKEKYIGHMYYQKIKVKCELKIAKSGKSLDVKMKIPGYSRSVIWTKMKDDEK